MPWPSPGAKYCSDRCREEASKERRAEYLIKYNKALSDYKVSTGCAKCGYNKCAAALHFHHRDPSQKEFRVQVRHFYYQSERTKAELEKCDLLCANCHIETHHPPTEGLA